ncbi:hypothetical protein BN871_HH_00050 [Paenibacillus sp. P22]|nr:hypothetical protein BN871_HH_00050 [Paenibacillus sp. P22]
MGQAVPGAELRSRQVRLDDTRIGEIFSGQTPSRSGGELQVTPPPLGYPVPCNPDMPNEHAPGFTDMSN